MEIKELLEKDMEKDIIGKIYYDDLCLLEEKPNTLEYIEVSNKIKEIENNIMCIDGNELKESFLEYTENINLRESMDAENQFKLGFKTAIKLILEGLK